MIDRRMTSTKGAGGGPRYGAAGSRAPIVYNNNNNNNNNNSSNNALYGSSSGYGQHHYMKSQVGGDYQVYGQSQSQGQGYMMGYDRPNGSVASRLQREVETVSASSGSVNARRRNNRGTLEQVVESESTDGSRGEDDPSLSRRNEREQRFRGSVASREVSVRRGSVASQRLETNTRPASRLAATFSRAVEQDRKSSSPTFSGDETDKDFQFVGGNITSDKTIKYDPKNFSFRLKNRDSVVIEESAGRCSWRQVCCNSLYLGLLVTVIVFVTMLLSTSPQNYR